MQIIKKIAGYWRVLRDGRVVSTHNTKPEALRAMKPTQPAQPAGEWKKPAGCLDGGADCNGNG
jgi:hypothetical protein